MDEERPTVPVGAPSDGAGVPPAPSPAPAVRPRRWLGPIGIAAALVLAFVWGGLAYRELGPKTKALAAGTPLTAVAGAQSPPGWIGDFANAFCDGDAGALAARIGPPLTGNVAAITAALEDRGWSCSRITYLGGGANPKGAFYVYVIGDDTENEQWWVFTVMGDKVIAIE